MSDREQNEQEPRFCLINGMVGVRVDSVPMKDLRQNLEEEDKVAAVYFTTTRPGGEEGLDHYAIFHRRDIVGQGLGAKAVHSTSIISVSSPCTADNIHLSAVDNPEEWRVCVGQPFSYQNGMKSTGIVTSIVLIATPETAKSIQASTQITNLIDAPAALPGIEELDNLICV